MSLSIHKGASSSESGILRVSRFLSKLVSKQFFGKITLTFERGKIIHIRTEENLKPDDLETR